MTRRLLLLAIGIALTMGACTKNTATQQVLSSNDLIGLSVVAPNGELVGSLLGMLLAPAGGHIDYGVVQLAPGPLEFGKMPMHAAPNRVLVPWRLLTIAPTNNFLVANCSLDKVRNAPPAPDHLQVDQQDWDAKYTAYWCEGDSCSETIAGSPQPTSNEQR